MSLVFPERPCKSKFPLIALSVSLLPPRERDAREKRKFSKVSPKRILPIESLDIVSANEGCSSSPIVEVINLIEIPTSV